jgi:hypothetical protein
MGSFERFKTKTHFNSLKRLVGVTALAALAVKLLTVALATAAGGGTPLDLLARVPASLADLGAALLVFEVLRTRRPLQLAARSAILVGVSPVLFVASGIHGDRVGVAVALLLLAMYLLVDRDAPLVAGITLAIASRVEPMALLAAPVAMAAVASGAAGGRQPDDRAGHTRLVHFGGALAGALLAVWVPTLAWDWDSLAAAPSGEAGPGGLGPGWMLARSVDQGLAGWLAGGGRPLVLALAVLPAVVWVRRRPRRVYAAVGLVLLAPLALGPAWSPRDLVWPAVFGYLGDARWASIYAVAAGATLLWTSTWWGTGPPWHGGVGPATVPAGAVAGLGLITWVVSAPGWCWAGGRPRSRRALAPSPRTRAQAACPRRLRWRGRLRRLGRLRRRGRLRGLWTTERTAPRGRLRSPPGGRTRVRVGPACPRARAALAVRVGLACPRARALAVRMGLGCPRGRGAPGGL